MKDEFEQQNVAPVAVSSGSVQAPAVRLRAAAPGDDEFLLAVFASTRSEELTQLAWDPAQAQAFLKMQFITQLRNYEAAYPNAENNIVLLGEQAIGRILVDRSGDEILLVDIAILPEHRNSGIGSALIRDLLREAGEAARPVKLHVFNYSAARRLYERLGFSPIGGDEVYLEMRWSIQS